MDIKSVVSRSYDVVVIGAGPAGSSLAATVAGEDLSTLVIDKRKVPGEPVQCAEFISRAGFDGPRNCIAQPIVNMITHLPDGSTHVSKSPGYTIHREIFDNNLAEHARSKGAEYLMNTFAQIVGDHVVARNRFASPIKAKAIINATGPDGSNAFAYSRQVTLPINRPTNDIHVWLSPAFPGGYGWVFPKKNLANIGVATTVKQNLKEILDQFISSVQQEFGCGENFVHVTGGRIPMSGVTTFVNGNVIKVGDAAGVTHPISGEGIHRAVRSGAIAASAVISSLQSGAKEKFSDYTDEMLDLYGHYFNRDKGKRDEWSKALTTGGPTMEQYRRLWIGFREYYET